MLRGVGGFAEPQMMRLIEVCGAKNETAAGLKCVVPASRQTWQMGRLTELVTVLIFL